MEENGRASDGEVQAQRSKLPNPPYSLHTIRCSRRKKGFRKAAASPPRSPPLRPRSIGQGQSRLRLDRATDAGVGVGMGGVNCVPVRS